jgi:hypothetical protein
MGFKLNRSEPGFGRARILLPLHTSSANSHIHISGTEICIIAYTSIINNDKIVALDFQIEMNWLNRIKIKGCASVNSVRAAR